MFVFVWMAYTLFVERWDEVSTGSKSTRFLANDCEYMQILRAIEIGKELKSLITSFESQ